MTPSDRTSAADVPGPHGGRPVVTAGAPHGATEAAIVALHGRGATAQGVVNLLEPVYRHGVTFLAPAAERSRWYPHAAEAPLEHNEPYLSSALAVVDTVVKEALEFVGGDPNRVVLLGFSQGACVAAEYAARNPRGYGGLVVLAGTLLGPAVDPNRYDGSLEGAPVLVGCGRDDRRVSLERVRETAAVFRALEGDVAERIYDGAGHEVPDAAFASVAEMIEDVVDER